MQNKNYKLNVLYEGKEKKGHYFYNEGCIGFIAIAHGENSYSVFLTDDDAEHLIYFSNNSFSIWDISTDMFESSFEEWCLEGGYSFIAPLYKDSDFLLTLTVKC